MTAVDLAAALERLECERDSSNQAAEQFRIEGSWYPADIAAAHGWAFALAIDILEGNG